MASSGDARPVDDGTVHTANGATQIHDEVRVTNTALRTENVRTHAVATKPRIPDNRNSRQTRGDADTLREPHPQILTALFFASDTKKKNSLVSSPRCGPASTATSALGVAWRTLFSLTDRVLVARVLFTVCSTATEAGRLLIS
jgi:hypothetical protein